MSKRTLGLIIFLVILTVILLYIAIVPKKPQPTPVAISPTIIASITPKPVGHTTLSLLPNPLVVSSNSASIDVVVDSNGDQLTAVQAEISFDPKVITPTTITEGNFFNTPLELLKKIDVENGRISYAVATPPNAGSKSGKGTVATINFTINPQSTVNQTTLTLLPKSIATAERIYDSVLIKSEGTTIIITPQK